MKQCRICKKYKSVNQFHKKKDTKDGYRNECKSCIKKIQENYKKDPDFKKRQKQYNKERYWNNREKELQRKKEFYWNNREKILNYKKSHREKEEIKEKIKQYKLNNKEKISIIQKNYRNNNPHIIAWRRLLKRTLNYFGTKKSRKTINELGYSPEELKNHIEKLFEKGMSWENWGEWHIDHIKPLSSFDENTSPNVVNSLKNLQPLWKKDNLKISKILINSKAKHLQYNKVGFYPQRAYNHGFSFLHIQI